MKIYENPTLCLTAWGLKMGNDAATREAAQARELAVVGAQVKAFDTGVPAWSHCPTQTISFFGRMKQMYYVR
jgi:hypothetical protein